MAHEQVAIQERDGTCPTHVFAPAGGGAWPAVVFYMDAGGIRPALLDMARRLAEAGYLARARHDHQSVAQEGPSDEGVVRAGIDPDARRDGAGAGEGRVRCALGIELAPPTTILGVGGGHLQHLDPGLLEEAEQAGTIAAGRLDPDASQ